MKSRLFRTLLGHININLAIAGLMSFALVGVAFASSTSQFTHTINAGSLAIDIVDSSYVTVSSPTVAFGASTFSFTCKTGANRSSGTLGTASQQIYVSNPDAADGGWVASIAGSSVAAVWDGAADYDFNDAGGSGCTDGADSPDTVGGQMTIDPSAGTLAVGQCASCVTTNVTKGSSNAFVSGTTDTITVLTGAAGSDDIGDWKLTGVSALNTIPAEQAPGSDYDISMVLSIVAS